MWRSVYKEVQGKSESRRIESATQGLHLHVLILSSLQTLGKEG